MAIIHDQAITTEPLRYPQGKVATLDMLRLDTIHPVMSGNKWFKLKYNIEYALSNGYTQLVTFGGGYSNHLIAAAAAAKAFNLRITGIVRGMYAHPTPTLTACAQEGMELVYVTKEAYQNKTDHAWLQTVVPDLSCSFIIPEGGANELGRKGAEAIAAFVSEEYTHVAVSAGSGTTAIGLRNALPSHQRILAFAPMKGGSYLREETATFIEAMCTAQIEWIDHFHFGGFGKWNDELIRFMHHFYLENNIRLDMIYTGKMMYGISRLIEDHYFEPTDRILCIHTGGLQGNAAISEL
jgi:1-aminocyclopropane-1-carboxylate deaminase